MKILYRTCCRHLKQAKKHLLAVESKVSEESAIMPWMNTRENEVYGARDV